MHYHSSKENIVAHSLNVQMMGSVAHIKNERKELAKDVHRLDRLVVFIMSIYDHGVTFHNGAESSLVVEFKECQYGDLILIELKGVIH